MLPTTPNGVPAEAPSDPQFTNRVPSPRGVIQKNLKILLYIAAVAVLVLATLVSSFRKKPALATDKTKNGNASNPAVQDNTANNVATLHAQLAAEDQKPLPAAPSGQPSDGTPSSTSCIQRVRSQWLARSHKCLRSWAAMLRIRLCRIGAGKWGEQGASHSSLPSSSRPSSSPQRSANVSTPRALRRTSLTAILLRSIRQDSRQHRRPRRCSDLARRPT